MSKSGSGSGSGVTGVRFGVFRKVGDMSLDKSCLELEGDAGKDEEKGEEDVVCGDLGSGETLGGGLGRGVGRGVGHVHFSSRMEAWFCVVKRGRLGCRLSVCRRMMVKGCVLALERVLAREEREPGWIVREGAIGTTGVLLASVRKGLSRILDIGSEFIEFRLVSGGVQVYLCGMTAEQLGQRILFLPTSVGDFLGRVYYYELGGVDGSGVGDVLECFSAKSILLDWDFVIGKAAVGVLG